jgi:hypothetical protein
MATGTGSLAKRVFTSITLTVDDLKDLAEVLSELSSNVTVKANRALLNDGEQIRDVAAQDVVIDAIEMRVQTPEAAIEFTWERSNALLRLQVGGARSYRVFDSAVRILEKAPKNEYKTNLIDLSVPSRQRVVAPLPAPVKMTWRKTGESKRTASSRRQAVAGQRGDAQGVGSVWTRWWKKITG